MKTQVLHRHRQHQAKMVRAGLVINAQGNIWNPITERPLEFFTIKNGKELLFTTGSYNSEE